MNKQNIVQIFPWLDLSETRRIVEIDMPEQPHALMVFAPNQLPGYVVVNTAASVDADVEAVIIEDQLPQEVAEWIKSMPYTEV